MGTGSLSLAAHVEPMDTTSIDLALRNTIKGCHQPHPTTDQSTGLWCQPGQRVQYEWDLRQVHCEAAVWVDSRVLGGFQHADHAWHAQCTYVRLGRWPRTAGIGMQI